MEKYKKYTIAMVVFLAVILITACQSLEDAYQCETNANGELVCYRFGVSMPAHYVYWIAGTDTPMPTATPYPTQKPDYPPNLVICNGVEYPVEEVCTRPALRNACQSIASCKKYEPTEVPTPTPLPTPTPYVRKYTFYKSQNVNVNGVVVRFGDADPYSPDPAVTQGYFQIKNPETGEVIDERNYYLLHFWLFNTWSRPVTVPFVMEGRITEIKTDNGILVGEWTTDLYSYAVMEQLEQPVLSGGMDTLTLQPRTWTKFILPIPAPEGNASGMAFQINSDLMSSDPEAYITFINAVDPKLCRPDQETSPEGCHYHAEKSAEEYAPLQSPPLDMVEYYILPELGGSSRSYYQPEMMGSGSTVFGGDVGGRNPAITFDWSSFVWEGPTSNQMPVTNVTINQYYGCSGFSGTKGCVYQKEATNCDATVPKCKINGHMGWGFHDGIDFGGTPADAVYSVSSGIIDTMTCTGPDNWGDYCENYTYGYGRLVVVKDYANSLCFYYAHLSAYPDAIPAVPTPSGYGPGMDQSPLPAVEPTPQTGLEGTAEPDYEVSPTQMRVGSYVTSGMVLGKIGTTGGSSGNHLHFEIRKLTPSGSCSGSVWPEAFLGIDPGINN